VTDDTKEKTSPAFWNFFHSAGGGPGDPDLIVEEYLDEALGRKAEPDEAPGLEAFGVRVSGASWTGETRLCHALVRRLGGFVELTKEEVEPGPGDGLVMSGEGGRVRMRSDSCGLPDRVVERFNNDPAFNRLCHVLGGLIEGGRFSASDLVDAETVARAMSREGSLRERGGA
jgi:hypothetical protein